MRENVSLQSPIASLYYEYYTDIDSLKATLQARETELQLVVSSLVLTPIKTFGFGLAQQPALDDYADGVDTMDFLLGLG